MRLALFDIDGTLLRGQGSGREAMEHAFAEVFGLSRVPDLAGRLHLGGALDPHIISDIGGLLELPVDAVQSALTIIEQSYVRHLKRLIGNGARYELLPGVRELLEGVSRHTGIAAGLLTGNFRAGAEQKLSTHQLQGYFQDGGFGEDGETRIDVARVAYQRLAAMAPLKVPPASVTVIGDTPRDVECGQRNGFRTLAVTTGWSTAEELEAAGADVVLSDLADTEQVIDFLMGAPRMCPDVEQQSKE